MKRRVRVVLMALLVTPAVASAQMMGEGMGGGSGSHPAAASREANPPALSAGMGAGMMGQGMMPGMMGQGEKTAAGCMMPGGMMGPGMPGMMGPMMSPMMDGMMPGPARGCMMMAEGMMAGQLDLARMRTMLGLSDAQSEELRARLRPFQRDAILTLASLKVAELELADLLAGSPVDFGKVEAKLKEAEGLRTKVRLAHVRAADAVKGVLSKEQLERLGSVREGSRPQAPAAPPKGAVPGDEHEQHH